MVKVVFDDEDGFEPSTEGWAMVTNLTKSIIRPLADGPQSVFPEDLCIAIAHHLVEKYGGPCEGEGKLTRFEFERLRKENPNTD